MEIRNFNGSDVSSVVDCYNESHLEDPITRENFIKKLLFDANFDKNGLFICEESGEMLGFINCIYRKIPIDSYNAVEEDNGWISLFAVKRSERFETVANALLKKAEDYFLLHKKTNISTGYYPTYFYQGVSKEHCRDYTAVFESIGYTCKESFARDLNLSSYIPPKNISEKTNKLLEEGFYIGPMKDEYVCSLIDPKEPINGKSSAFEYGIRLSDLDYDRFQIAAIDGHVVGVCVFGDPLSSPERFGPFAVTKEHQGKGIGGILMNNVLSEMKKRGLHNAWMQWTPVTGAADSMYKKVGFTITKTYLTFSKTLNNNKRAE